MGDGASGYRVPKQPILVELALAAGEPLRAELYLAEQQAQAYRREEILDLLERDEAFLPARAVETGAWTVVNRDAIRWLAIRQEAEEPEPVLYEHARDVTVVLLDGQTLQGKLLYNAPADHARLVDILNAPGRFFRLWRGQEVLAVNRAHVACIREE
jgi:hypothetical protein